MNDLEQKIRELEDELATLNEQLRKVTLEQQDASKLLIRRDLALGRANEQLKSLDESKSEFISVAAHQLRTPLAAIKWILHMLAENQFKDDAERREFTDKATESTERMITLVNDLLEADHIQSGKDQFIFGPVNIRSIVGSVVTELQGLADARNITISLDLCTDSRMTGDAVKLRALFQNIVENALKYTMPGGNVKISSVVEENNLKIAVTDSGIGIPTEQKIHIFSKFFRAANAMKLETSGSGLGLFIAKQIVERHGGKLWYESEVGKGTTFYVTLPLVSTSETTK